MRVTARRIAGFVPPEQKTNMMGAVKLRRRKTFSLAEAVMRRHMETGAYDFPPVSLVLLMLEEREAKEHAFKAAELLTVLNHMEIHQNTNIYNNQTVNRLAEQIRYELDMAGAMGGQETVRLERIFERLMETEGIRFDRDLRQLRESLIKSQEILERQIWRSRPEIRTVRALPDYKEIWRQSVAYCKPAREFLNFLERMETEQQTKVLRLLGERKEMLFSRLYEMKQGEWLRFSEKTAERLERVRRVENERILWRGTKATETKVLAGEFKEKRSPERETFEGKVREAVRRMEEPEWDILVETMYESRGRDAVSRRFVEELRESAFEEYERQTAERRLEYKNRLLAMLNYIDEDTAEVFLTEIIGRAQIVHAMEQLRVFEDFAVLVNQRMGGEERPRPPKDNGFEDTDGGRHTDGKRAVYDRAAVTAGELGEVIGYMEEPEWDALVEAMYKNRSADLVSRRFVKELQTETFEEYRSQDVRQRLEKKNFLLMVLGRLEKEAEEHFVSEILERVPAGSLESVERTVHFLDGETRQYVMETVRRVLTEKEQRETFEWEEAAADSFRALERFMVLVNRRPAEGTAKEQGLTSEQLAEAIAYMEESEWDVLVETMYENRSTDLVSRRFAKELQTETFEEYRKQEAWQRLAKKNSLLTVFSRLEREAEERFASAVLERTSEISLESVERLVHSMDEVRWRHAAAGVHRMLGDREELEITDREGLIRLLRQRRETENRAVGYETALDRKETEQESSGGGSHLLTLVNRQAGGKETLKAEVSEEELKTAVDGMKTEEWDSLVEIMYENRTTDLVSRRFINEIQAETFEEYIRRESRLRLDTKDCLLTVLKQMGRTEAGIAEAVLEKLEILASREKIRNETGENAQVRSAEKAEAGMPAADGGITEEGFGKMIARMGEPEWDALVEIMYENRSMDTVSRRFVNELRAETFEEYKSRGRRSCVKEKERLAELVRQTDRRLAEQFVFRILDRREAVSEGLILETETSEEFVYPPIHMVITRRRPPAPDMPAPQPHIQDIVRRTGSAGAAGGERQETDIRFVSSKPSFTTAAKEYREQMQQLADRLEEQMQQLEELKKGQAMLIKRTDTEQMTAQVLGKLQNQMRLERLRRGM